MATLGTVIQRWLLNGGGRLIEVSFTELGWQKNRDLGKWPLNRGWLDRGPLYRGSIVEPSCFISSPNRSLVTYNVIYASYFVLDVLFIPGIETEQRIINAIATARSKIGKEISQLNERLKASRNQIQTLKSEISSLEQEDQKDQAGLSGQPQLQVQISPLKIDYSALN